MRKYRHKPVPRDRPEDVAMQEEIRSRANYSMALLGKGAYLRTGRFLYIRPPERAETYRPRER
ncbi:MAG: hypothetical protein WCK90_00925 [archaeon]